MNNVAFKNFRLGFQRKTLLPVKAIQNSNIREYIGKAPLAVHMQHIIPLSNK